ncbi:MAG: hypothetical protein COA99_13655 [Moraxellaceae bacterium]|nr:MAG: hypothetical protein COA99_13655 [Moraxellaceae bacterium]
MANIESNNEILRESIVNMLALDAGVQIEIAGSLYIRKHSNEEYVVGGVEEKMPYQVNEWKETFQCLERALDYLFTKRNQCKIGNDF